MADSGNLPAVIFDTGSFMSKAGFAGEDQPSVLMRTVVGRLKFRGMPTPGLKDVEVGDDVFPRAALYTMKYPVECGQITNYDDIERIYHKLYEKLGIAPEEHGAFVVDATFVPFSTRERQMQVFFETFNARSYYAESAPVLSLHSIGKKDGMVVELGDGRTQLCAVLDGHVLAPGSTDFTVSARDVTCSLESMLSRQGYEIVGFPTREKVRVCKETFCNAVCPSSYDFYALKPPYGDNREPLPPTELRTFAVDDQGTEWKLTPRQMFEHSESYFNPSLLGRSSPSLHQACLYSYDRLRRVKSVSLGHYTENASSGHVAPIPFTLSQASSQHILDGTLHELIGRNWHIFGGGSLLENFRERLESELHNLIQPPQPPPSPSGEPQERPQINVIAPPHRHYSSWLGASMLASQPSYSSLCISIADYDEHGPSLIHKRSVGGLVEIRP